MKHFLILLPILLSFSGLQAEEETPKNDTATAGKKDPVEEPDASKMDFGAKMLDKLVEAGFSREQQMRAIDTLKNHRPAIQKICDRLVAHIETTKQKSITEDEAAKQLEKIQKDLMATNQKIERDLLRIASNEQIVRLKLSLRKEKKKAALVKSPESTED